MKKLKTPNNRGVGVLGADKVLVVFAGCGANALSCLQNNAKSVYCNYLVGLISKAHQAILRLPSVLNAQ
ncbi:hypothetical protein EI035_10930 [Escherichia coli]|nr:hypothetical protein [Escherichia coli]PKE91118.1 hypothetical protein CW273_01015 [Escherichia coli]PLB79010.1 hypothetical protein APX96_03600 [Escherichia coli]PWD27481.1 hypothetical protein APX98_12240 [Escherichia coli]PWD27762.1 hypothetical protein APX97_13755 [Escherichia coli]